MLIIIEGVDGTGKSTLIEALKKFFSRTVYVINYSYPKGWETNQEAAFARGEYYASLKIFKAILEKDPDAVIICDRFHLGEYTYGPVKREYPEWLADLVFDIEDEMIKELGKDNVRLIILGVSKPEIVKERSNKPNEYLKELVEYEQVNLRYSMAAVRTKLPMISIPTDYYGPEKVFERVVNFVTGKL